MRHRFKFQHALLLTRYGTLSKLLNLCFSFLNYKIEKLYPYLSELEYKTNMFKMSNILCGTWYVLNQYKIV